MCFKTNSVSQMFSPTEILFLWLLRSQSELWGKITELTKCSFWTWQLMIFSLEYQYIYHISDCNYHSHLSMNSSRNFPFLWCPLPHLQSSQAVSVGKPRAWAWSQCNVGLNKEKTSLFIATFRCKWSHGCLQPPAQQLGLALRWAGCRQCCVANYWNFYGFVYQSVLPPDLKHLWEQARCCRNFGGFKSFWVQFWRAAGAVRNKTGLWCK